MIRRFYAGLLGTVNKPGSLRKIAFRAVISLGILALLLWWLPTESLVEALKSVSVSTWIIVVSGFVFGHIVSAFKWRLLLQAVNINLYKLEAVRAHGAGLFANLCLPSVVGGDLVRAGVVMRDRGNIETIAFGSLADRVNDTFALVLIAAVAGIFIPGITDMRLGLVMVSLAVMLPLGVLAGIIAVRVIPASRLPGKLQTIVVKVNTALTALLGAPRIAVFALLLSIAIQSGFILLNILLAGEMGLPTTYALWFFAWPMAKLVALAPISLGGIGVREAALAGIMAPLGLNTAHVVAQSLSWEAVLILSGLTSGLIVSMMPGYKNKIERGGGQES